MFNKSTLQQLALMVAAGVITAVIINRMQKAKVIV
jgi:hypothetical protein